MVFNNLLPPLSVHTSLERMLRGEGERECVCEKELETGIGGRSKREMFVFIYA